MWEGYAFRSGHSAHRASRELHDGDGGHGTELREELLHGPFAGRFVGDGQDQGRRDRGGRGEVVFLNEGAVGRRRHGLSGSLGCGFARSLVLCLLLAQAGLRREDLPDDARGFFIGDVQRQAGREFAHREAEAVLLRFGLQCGFNHRDAVGPGPLKLFGGGLVLLVLEDDVLDFGVQLGLLDALVEP